MKITALLENTTRRSDMLVEHGLSLYIEAAGKKILFDAGQSDAFYKNAQTLGIDPSAVDLAVLSHGHYDHGGGLGRFLEINSRAPVYLREEALLPYYNGREKYIGLDVSLKKNPRLVFTSDTESIGDGFTLFSFNEKPRRAEAFSSGLTERVGESFIPDNFRHEQYLLIEEDGKRVLISGCSHKGILDIVSWVKPDVLVGGFHYSKLALGEYLVESARELDSYPTLYYTCHCTGVEQFEFMRRYMKNLNYLSCGEAIIL